MNNTRPLQGAIIGSVIATAIIIISGAPINAQNVNAEYRQWQNAQRKAEKEHRDYLRTRSLKDYRQWQNALMRERREYAEYQRASSASYGWQNSRNDNVNYRRYRVYRNGSYYDTDSRGAELLRQAVRNGYSQGYRRGMADRRNRSRYDYYNDSMYRSGEYGYQSYVARNQYQYYFQQGFQRGYEDGYYSRTRYGVRSGNSFNILSNVLNAILQITQDT